MWGVVRDHALEKFRNIFKDMNDDPFYNLDNHNSIDIYVLHVVFGPVIFNRLELYRRIWNEHGVRTAGRQSPSVMIQQGFAGFDHINNNARMPWEEACRWHPNNQSKPPSIPAKLQLDPRIAVPFFNLVQTFKWDGDESEKSIWRIAKQILHCVCDFG